MDADDGSPQPHPQRVPATQALSDTRSEADSTAAPALSRRNSSTGMRCGWYAANRISSMDSCQCAGMALTECNVEREPMLRAGSSSLSGITVGR